MKSYSIEKQNIFEEKRKFSLILRKNKINFKLFEGRHLPKNHKKKISNIFDETNNITINNIRSKFDDILLDINSNEESFLNILDGLLEKFESFIEFNKNLEINEEIIKSPVLEKIYENLIIHGYINDEKIVLDALLIFSMELFLYNHFPDLKLYKNKYITEDKYIYLFFSFLNFDSEEIIYNTYKFIGLLAKDSEDIFNKLYEYKILDHIIDNNKFTNNIEVIKLKLFCISNFELESRYNEDYSLSLKIQNLYISIFNDYILTKEFEDELFKYFVELLDIFSFCTNEIYLQKLLDSKIITFLINISEKNNSINRNVLKIIGNMSITSNEEILSRLHKEVIQYLLNIIKDEKSDDFLLGLAIWNINNFLESKNLCSDTFFKNDLISIYKNYILNHDSMNENTFKEICLSYKYLVIFINETKNYVLFQKTNLITLIIEGFRKIKYISNLEKTGNNIIEVLCLLFTVNNEYIADFNKFTFESNGGIEYIFDKINYLFLEQNNKNKDNIIEEYNNDEIGILTIIDFIKKKFFNN